MARGFLGPEAASTPATAFATATPAAGEPRGPGRRGRLAKGSSPAIAATAQATARLVWDRRRNRLASQESQVTEAAATASTTSVSAGQMAMSRRDEVTPPERPRDTTAGHPSTSA